MSWEIHTRYVQFEFPLTLYVCILYRLTVTETKSFNIFVCGMTQISEIEL